MAFILTSTCRLRKRCKTYMKNHYFSILHHIVELCKRNLSQVISNHKKLSKILESKLIMQSKKWKVLYTTYTHTTLILTLYTVYIDIYIYIYIYIYTVYNIHTDRSRIEQTHRVFGIFLDLSLYCAFPAQSYQNFQDHILKLGWNVKHSTTF